MTLATIFYDWVLPRQNEFINDFGNNENKVRLAKAFWKSIEQNEIFLFLLSVVVIAIAACALYYTWYNNMPKRHYRIRHWSYWLIGAIIATIGITYGLSQFLLENITKLQGTGRIMGNLIIANVAYSTGLYLIMSFVWCNYGPTNAYRFLKFN